MTTYFVYELSISDSDQPFYVGYTNNLNSRLSQHIKDAGTREKHLRKGRKILRAISEGKEILIKKVFQSLSMKEALSEEVRLIKYYGRLDTNTGILYNLTDGGDGHRGYKWSDGAKAAKSKAMIGDQRNKGRSRPDAREKMSKRVYAYNQNGSFLAEYNSQKEAAIDLGCLQQSLSKCLKGICRYTTGKGKAYQFSSEKLSHMEPIVKSVLDPKPVKVYKQTEDHRCKLSESNKRAKAK